MSQTITLPEQIVSEAHKLSISWTLSEGLDWSDAESFIAEVRDLPKTTLDKLPITSGILKYCQNEDEWDSNEIGNAVEQIPAEIISAGIVSIESSQPFLIVKEICHQTSLAVKDTELESEFADDFNMIMIDINSGSMPGGDGIRELIYFASEVIEEKELPKLTKLVMGAMEGEFDNLLED